MRVVSQNKSIDLDYNSHTFYIKDVEKKDEVFYSVLAYKDNPNNFAVMGFYSTEEKAQKALLGMSSKYKLYLITDNNGFMTMTDAIVCELDKPFNKITIEEKEGTVYYFPQEDEI